MVDRGTFNRAPQQRHDHAPRDRQPEERRRRARRQGPADQPVQRVHRQPGASQSRARRPNVAAARRFVDFLVSQSSRTRSTRSRPPPTRRSTPTRSRRVTADDAARRRRRRRGRRLTLSLDLANRLPGHAGVSGHAGPAAAVDGQRGDLERRRRRADDRRRRRRDAAGDDLQHDRLPRQPAALPGDEPGTRSARARRTSGVVSVAAPPAPRPLRPVDSQSAAARAESRSTRRAADGAESARPPRVKATVSERIVARICERNGRTRTSGDVPARCAS